MAPAEIENAAVSEQLQQAFARKMLFDSQQYGVVFYDADLIIRGWSVGATYITGWDADEVMGQSTSLLFVAEDRERKLHEHEMAAAASTGVAEDERWHQRKDGSRFWSSGLSMLLDTVAGVSGGLVKVFRDATHLRVRMRYLENSLNEGVSAQQERDRFLGTIAHEMRNPLAPLRTATDLLRLLTRDNTRVEQPLQVMDRQQTLLERLVEDLVDVTRIHTGKMSLSYQTIELQAFLAEVLDSMRARSDAAGITVEPVWPSVPIMVEVDPARLQQVVTNLLTNAIKFNHRGGHVWINATVDQTHLVIYLKDSGRGIDAHLLPKIFDAFTQADRSTTGRGDGLGIGLAVVKEIVSLHHGTIEVRSEGPGKGAEFVVRIPQLRTPNLPEEPAPRH